MLFATFLLGTNPGCVSEITVAITWWILFANNFSMSLYRTVQHAMGLYSLILEGLGTLCNSVTALLFTALCIFPVRKNSLTAAPV